MASLLTRPPSAAASRARDAPEECPYRQAGAPASSISAATSSTGQFRLGARRAAAHGAVDQDQGRPPVVLLVVGDLRAIR